ncbi:hypothetical protein ACLOJK_000003 [Asimina triloba]
MGTKTCGKHTVEGWDYLEALFAPMLPLQRADDTYLSSNIQTASVYEDMVYQEEIPTMFIWSHGGKEVSVTGSWDDWKTQ